MEIRNYMSEYKCNCERCGQDMTIQINAIKRHHENVKFSYMVENEAVSFQDWINFSLYWSRKEDLYFCGECREELDNLIREFLDV